MATSSSSSPLSSSLVIYHKDLTEWIQTFLAASTGASTSSTSMASPGSKGTISTDYGKIGTELTERISKYESFIATAIAKSTTETTNEVYPNGTTEKDTTLPNRAPISVDIDMVQNTNDNTGAKESVSSTNPKPTISSSVSSGTNVNNETNIEILPIETVPLLYSSAATETAATNTSTTTDTSPTLLQEYYHDLICLVLKGVLSSYHLIGILNTAQINCTKTLASSSLLVDVLWMLSLEMEMVHSVVLPSSTGSSSSSSNSNTTGGASNTKMDESSTGSIIPPPSTDNITNDSKKLGSIIRLLCDRQIISRTVVLERLELDTIEYSGYGRMEISRGKLVKTNTRLLYTQLKYNMLAEESEGYAKLLELLLEPLPPQNYEPAVEKLCIRLQSLCGQFSLDPNRIFDIALDAYEMRTRKRILNNPSSVNASSSSSSFGLDRSIVTVPEPAFVSLFDGKLFSRDNLVQLLGFKFSQYAKSKEELGESTDISSSSTGTTTTASTVPAPTTDKKDGTTATTKPTTTTTVPNATASSTTTPAPSADTLSSRKMSTPTSLYTLAAWLIINGCIGLRELWIHLGPTPVVCKSITEAISQALKDEAKPATLGGLGGGSSASSSLAASTTLGDDFASSLRSTGDASSATFVPVIGNTPSAASGTADPWTHPAAVISNEAERIHQKVGIAAGLLRCGSWSWGCQAITLITIESETGQVADLSTPLPIEIQLQEWYKRHDALNANNNHHHQQHHSLSVRTDTAPSLSEVKRILSPSATSGTMFDICSFPSIARAGCVLARAALNLSTVLPSQSIRGRLAAAVGCPPGANAVTFWSRQPKSTVVGTNGTVNGVNSILNNHGADENPVQINSQGTCPFLVPAKVVAQIPGILSPLLEFLGPAISCDSSLLSDIFRLCKDIAVSENESRNLSSASLTVQTITNSSQTNGSLLSNSNGNHNNNPWSNVPEEVRSSMLALLRTYVLPSLSLCGSNANIAFEAWEMLKSFHWSIRYEIYTYLKDASHEGHPALSFARNRATAAARQTMKRVAVETLRQSGRMLGKLSHSNPFPVMEILVSTLERYDNLIPLSTEAMKYVGPLSLDVVAFTLVDRLWMDRPRSKGDGMTSADWLSSLAAFTGAFYRRYHQVEIGALLHRIICGLTGLGSDKDPLGSSDSTTHDQGSVDKLLADLPVLTLFRELITRMCGLEALPDVTDEQLNACGGSETLRNQFLSKNLVVGPAPWSAGTMIAKLAPKPSEAAEKIITLNSFKRALIRLRDTLLHGYGGGSVAIPLFILLAQQQDLVLFGVPTTPLQLSDTFDINNDEDVETIPLDFGAEVAKPPLKVVGSQYDSVHASLMLYADLLRVHALPTLTTYKNMLPTLADLMGPYRLSPSLAWLLARPVIRSASYPGIVDGLADINLSANPFLAANMGAAYIATVSPILSTDSNGSAMKIEEGSTNITDAGAIEDGQITTVEVSPVTDESVQKAIQASLSNPWSMFNPEFRTMVQSLPIPSPKLWDVSLSPELYIFFWSHTLYDISVPGNGYEKASTALREATAALDQLQLTDTRSIADRERVRTRYLETIKKLRSESPAQTAHVKRVIAGLTSLRERLFSSLPDKKVAIGAVMQHCILPRALLSPEDALYCAKFLLLLHDVNVPYFVTPSVIERVVTFVAPHLVASTEIEAACLGILFGELFKTVIRWRENVSVYNNEAASKVTFSSAYSDIHAKRLTHEEYVKITDIIFDRMLKISVTALSSTEYMETKNALVMLHRLGSVFPSNRTGAEAIMKQTSKLKDDSSRSDIKAMTVAYHGMLEKKFVPPVPPPPPSNAPTPKVLPGGPTGGGTVRSLPPGPSAGTTTSSGLRPTPPISNLSRPSSGPAPLPSSSSTTMRPTTGTSSTTNIIRPSGTTTGSVVGSRPSAPTTTSSSSLSSSNMRPSNPPSSSSSSAQSSIRTGNAPPLSSSSGSGSNVSSGARPLGGSTASSTTLSKAQPIVSATASSGARPGSSLTSTSSGARPTTGSVPSTVGPSKISRSRSRSPTPRTGATITRPGTVSSSNVPSSSQSSQQQRAPTNTASSSSTLRSSNPLPSSTSNDRDRDYYNRNNDNRPISSSSNNNISLSTTSTSNQSPRNAPSSGSTTARTGTSTSSTTTATTPTNNNHSQGVVKRSSPSPRRELEKDTNRSGSTINRSSNITATSSSSATSANASMDRKRPRDDDPLPSSSSSSSLSNRSGGQMTSPSSDTNNRGGGSSGGPVVIKRNRGEDDNNINDGGRDRNMNTARSSDYRDNRDNRGEYNYNPSNNSNSNRSESRGQSNNNTNNNNNNGGNSNSNARWAAGPPPKDDRYNDNNYNGNNNNRGNFNRRG